MRRSSLPQLGGSKVIAILVGWSVLCLAAIVGIGVRVSLLNSIEVAGLDVTLTPSPRATEGVAVLPLPRATSMPPPPTCEPATINFPEWKHPRAAIESQIPFTARPGHPASGEDRRLRAYTLSSDEVVAAWIATYVWAAQPHRPFGGAVWLRDFVAWQAEARLAQPEVT